MSLIQGNLFVLTHTEISVHKSVRQPPKTAVHLMAHYYPSNDVIKNGSNSTNTVQTSSSASTQLASTQLANTQLASTQLAHS